MWKYRSSRRYWEIFQSFCYGINNFDPKIAYCTKFVGTCTNNPIIVGYISKSYCILIHALQGLKYEHIFLLIIYVVIICNNATYITYNIMLS